MGERYPVGILKDEFGNPVGLREFPEGDTLPKSILPELDATDVGSDPAGSAASARAYAIQRENHTGTQAISTVTGLQGELDGRVLNNDSRLTNSREWTATTVTQAEAETGTATTRRAWTAQRVRQAIAAWWDSTVSASGKTVATGTAAQGRAALGLGTAAIQDVATSRTDSTLGRLLRVGDFGLGSTIGVPTINSGSADSLTATGFYRTSGAITDVPASDGLLKVYSTSSNSLVQEFVSILGSRSSYYRVFVNGEWTPWRELHHTGNLLQTTGTSTEYPMSQAATTSQLATKANTSTLGTAATADVATSSTDTVTGRVMRAGYRGIGRLAPTVPAMDLNTYGGGFYRIDTSDPDNPSSLGGALAIHGTTSLGSFGGGILHSTGTPAALWTYSVRNNVVYAWSIYHTGNTTVDSNGFIKEASPIIKMHSDRIESDNDEASLFERIGTGHYRITGCNGLRLDDGWYIETPHDRNKNPYFNVEWEQDHEPDAEAGVLDEPADVTLTIRCYGRVWNPQTGTYDNGDPVDIPDGRWIDLRMNEVRQPEPEEPEMPVEPELQPEIPTEPSTPSVVTMAQAKLALLYAGLYEQAEAFINDLPEPQKTAALIEWNHRQTLERDHPLVGQVVDGLGLTEQRLDELFLDASTR